MIDYLKQPLSDVDSNWLQTLWTSLIWLLKKALDLSNTLDYQLVIIYNIEETCTRWLDIIDEGCCQYQILTTMK